MKTPLLLLTGVILCSSCATSPTGRLQSNLVSETDIDQMGDQAWTGIQKQTPESNNQADRAFVEKVGRAVIAAGPLANQKWDIKLFESKDANAFALPGGHIGVYSGILPIAQNEAGLATVLAHETGHVIAQHGRERASQELLAQGVLTLAGVALDQSSHKDLILGALGVGAQVGVLLPYSRAQESEADHLGLMIMAKAGYDPQEALKFWQRMVSSSKGEPPAFLSDHPATSERIARIKDLMPEAVKDYSRANRHLAGGAAVPAP